MDILVRGESPAAHLFGYLAAMGGCRVSIAPVSSNRIVADICLDNEQAAILLTHAPELGYIFSECGRTWDRQEIGRQGERTCVRIAPITAVDNEALVARLRQMAMTAGCQFLSRPHSTNESSPFDLTVVADAAGAPDSAVFQVETEQDVTAIVAGTLPFDLDHAVISFRQDAGQWLQATLFPGHADGTRVVVEALQTVGIQCLSAVFADEFRDQTLQVTTDWQPATAWHAKQRFDECHVLMGHAAARGHDGLLADGRVALEDALALWLSLSTHKDTAAALAHYQAQRSKAGDRLVRVSRLLRDWYRQLAMYRSQEPDQFAFNYLTRHYRVSYERVKAVDPAFLERVERCVSPQSRNKHPTPPMFTPFRLRQLELPNRIVFSPMCMRQGTTDAMPTDFHLVHLSSRAFGGVGLVFAEMTAVMPPGRISRSCVGIYRDEHVAAWRRITEFIHTQTDAKVALQLGHAGRKGSTRPTADAWSVPLEEDGWELLSASAIPYTALSKMPRAAQQRDMDDVLAAYVQAAHRADSAGFDLIEIHMAHGYLLSSFISPLTNQREDAYGGNIENRMRFPLQVFDAVRAAWPADKPLSVRISASDWRSDGIVMDDVVELARMLKDAGCDIMTVSTGNTTSGVGSGRKTSTGNWAPDGRLFQVPFSDRVRNEAGIPTIAVGSILSWGDVNSVIAAGRADLCAIARGHLFDPYFVRHAAYAQEYIMKWPSSYRSAAEHHPRGRMERNNRNRMTG